MTSSRAQIERHELGFLVTLAGRPYPKTLPDTICVFASELGAREFADALNDDDIARCHDLIAKHGRFYKAAA